MAKNIKEEMLSYGEFIYLILYPSEILDHYERLGVKPGTSYMEIKKAYREKILYWHPDKNPENKKRAHTEFIALSESFEILKNRTPLL